MYTLVLVASSWYILIWQLLKRENGTNVVHVYNIPLRIRGKACNGPVHIESQGITSVVASLNPSPYILGLEAVVVGYLCELSVLVLHSIIFYNLYF